MEDVKRAFSYQLSAISFSPPHFLEFARLERRAFAAFRIYAGPAVEVDTGQVQRSCAAKHAAQDDKLENWLKADS